MTESKHLTVIGATGTLAVPAIKSLMQRGVQIKAIVRDLDKAAELLPTDIELVQADVSDLASLKTALQGSGAVYISLNTTSLDADLPFHAEREGVVNIVKAAQAAGVTQLMQIVGIDCLHEEFALDGMVYQTNLIRIPGMDAIRRSGIPFTFFHCSFFLDSFPVFIEDGTFAIMGDYQHPVFYTNTSDLAKNIASAIGNPAAYNQAFAVQGKEGMSFVDAAERFVAAYDPTIDVAVFPLETVRQLGLPQEQESFMHHMLSYVEQLSEQPVSENTWNLLGEPEHTIASFAKSLRD